jgi:hypothetical protein
LPQEAERKQMSRRANHRPYSVPSADPIVR